MDPLWDVAKADAVLVGETIGRQILLLVRHHDWDREAGERMAQADLLRDIFGDPFPPPAFDPAWRTLDVTTLAESIHEEKAFDWPPILADATKGAGCVDQATLGHCRGAVPHARGYWLLDQVMEGVRPK